MALIDVSELLLDPDFSTRFDVVRYTETVGANGRLVKTPTSYLNQVGVIYPSQSSLERGPDADVQPKELTVVTKFQLRGITTHNKPDVVQWRGSEYTVMTVSGYSHFGHGFIEAMCQSKDLTDPDYGH